MKRNKILVVVVLLAIIFSGNLLSNEVEAGNIKVIRIIFDGKEIKYDIAPILEQGRILVPLRVISENLGYKVGWNQKEWKATLTKDK